MQINKPGRNKVAIFSCRSLKEPFEKLKQTFLLLQLRGVILNNLFQLTIKDVSFDSSLKSNIHWAVLFSHAFKEEFKKWGIWMLDLWMKSRALRVLIGFQKTWNIFSPHFEYDYLYFCLLSRHLFWVFCVSVDFMLAFSELSSFKISEQKFICSPVGHNKVCTWLSCSEVSVSGLLWVPAGPLGFFSFVSCTWVVEVLICCGAAGADVWGEWECVCGSLPWRWSMTLLFSAPKPCSLCNTGDPQSPLSVW